jgi:hypothetical protein
MRLYTLLGLCSACVVACGSSKDPVANPAADTGVVTDTAPTPSVKFAVSNGARAMSGVTVRVLDKDGVELVRGTSGDDGIVTLTGYAFDDSLVTLITTKAGSGVEIAFASKPLLDRNRLTIGDKEGDPYRLFSFPNSTVLPKLTGKVTGVTLGNVGLHVVGGTAWQGTAGATFTARAPIGRKTTIVVQEFDGVWTGRSLEQTFGKWIGLDLEAMTADRMLDVDITAHAALPIKKSNVKLEITGGDGGPLGGTSTAYAFLTCGVPENVACGFPSKIAPNADGSAFDMELSYVEVPGLEPGPTYFRIQRVEDGAFTERLLVKRPAEGEVIKDFDTPAPITTTKLALSQPLFFEGITPGTNVLLNSSRPNGDMYFRVFIEASLATKPMQLPPLPDDVRAMIPASSQARVITTRDFAPGTGGQPTKAAISRTFTVTP